MATYRKWEERWLNAPTQVPKEVLKDYIYKINNNYYINNSEKISAEDYANVIRTAFSASGKVFIDGWTASLNATLQNYKENMMIVFWKNQGIWMCDCSSIHLNIA